VRGVEQLAVAQTAQRVSYASITWLANTG